MQFESYEDLVSWMSHKDRQADLKSIFSYLEECISKETNSLMQVALRRGDRSRVTKKFEQECHEDACQHYVDEINEALRCDEPLSHWHIISYRRKPHAWAVAKGIVEYKERMHASD